MEDSDSTAKNRAMRYPEGLPRKAESRRPQDLVHTHPSMFLVHHERLIVWLIRVVAHRVPRSVHAHKTAGITTGIRLMLCPKCEADRQIFPCMPFVLAVYAKVMESNSC